MKHNTITIALAAGAAALALAACGSDDGASQAAHVERLQDLGAAAQAQQDSQAFNDAGQRIQPAADPSPTALDASQAWADHKIQQWHEIEGADDFSQYYAPFNLVESWHKGNDGEVVLVVDPDITATDAVYLDDLGPANDLWLIAAVMLEQTDDEAPDLQTVTAVTSDDARSETATRAELAQMH